MIKSFLIIIAAVKAVQTTMTEEEFSEFYKKIEEQGVEIVKVLNKGNGIVVKKQVMSKQPVLCVDEKMRIFPGDQYALSQFVEGFKNLTALKVRVLYEKFVARRGGFLTEYVHSLPTFIHHYGNWTESQREYYKSVAIEKFDERELLELDEFQSIVDALKGVEGLPEEMLTYSSFMWVSFHVKSRYFWCKGDNGETVDCMYPFLDLVNFEPINYFSTVQEFFRVQDGKTCLVTSKELQPGDEFVIDYVIHRAPVFFLDYSIVSEGYQYDSIELFYRGRGFLLYAFRVNTELLEEIIGDKVEKSGIKRDEKALNGLKAYRKVLIEDFHGPGIREIRRDYSMLEDEVKRFINRFGVSIRTTYYNHLEKVDMEILRVLVSINF